MAERKKQSYQRKKKIEGNCLRTWDDYYNENYFDEMPKSKKWRDELIRQLAEASEDQTLITILSFCQRYKIPRDKLYKVSKDYPDIGYAFNQFKLALKDHRHVGYAQKGYKEYPIEDTWRLDPEVDEDQKRTAQLKKDQEAEPPTYIINVHDPKVDEPK